MTGILRCRTPPAVIPDGDVHRAVPVRDLGVESAGGVGVSVIHDVGGGFSVTQDEVVREVVGEPRGGSPLGHGPAQFGQPS